MPPYSPISTKLLTYLHYHGDNRSVHLNHIGKSSDNIKPLSPIQSAVSLYPATHHTQNGLVGSPSPFLTSKMCGCTVSVFVYVRMYAFV